MKQFLKKMLNSIKLVYRFLKKIYYIHIKSSPKVVYDFNDAYQYLLNKRYYHQGDFKENITDKLDKATDIELSIIVPCYNVERYVSDCLESIINQQVRYEIEIILVNDGSIDNTGTILSRYAKKYDNIILIEQENGGLSKARNTGLKHSRGKYIMFVDSDDILLSDSINYLLDECITNDCDVIEGDFIKFTEVDEVKNLNDLQGNYYLENGDIFKCNGFAWGKVYKRYLWDNVRFPEGMLYEDTIIKYVILRMCNKHMTSSRAVYGYRSNPLSITNSDQRSYKHLDTLWVIIESLKMARAVGLTENSVLYRLTLIQLGYFLYSRTYNFEIDCLVCELIIAKDILLSISQVRPNVLEKELDKLEKSILDLNLNAWIIYSQTMLNL